MEQITIDGLDENHFRLSIERMLREGEADEAAERLRALLTPYAGEGGVLPARFLTVRPQDVSLAGWNELGERISRYDRPNHRISALSVAITDPEAQAAGDLSPCIETSYFSDDAFPFSEAGRSDLLDGYSHYGCEWQGDSEQTDSTLSLKGADDLYGAIGRLEARLFASAEPDPDEIRAGTLGACYLGVLLHQTVRDSIRRNGLPRALCVMAGSNGVYPFFDAPVISSEEYDAEAPEAEASEAEAEAADEANTGAEAESGGGYTSLLAIQPRKGKKKPVILLGEADSEAAAREHEAHMADAGNAARSETVVKFTAEESQAPLTDVQAPVEDVRAPAQQEEPPVPAEPEIEPIAQAAEPVAEAAEPVVAEEPVRQPEAIVPPAAVAAPEPAAEVREESLRLDEADWIKALARPEEPTPLPRKAVDHGLGHQGHRLRAKMVPASEERAESGGGWFRALLRKIGLIS